jgi:UDP-N-acetylglucosamine 1-carboxyvinyltransferase
LAGVLADGRSTIINAAVEPEIVELIKMLQQMGAIIEFRANRMIIIDGVETLHGVEYNVPPDRLEAASFGMLAIATKGNILVKGARQEDLITFLNTIRRIGADYAIEAVAFASNVTAIR